MLGRNLGDMVGVATDTSEGGGPGARSILARLRAPKRIELSRREAFLAIAASTALILWNALAVVAEDFGLPLAHTIVVTIAAAILVAGLLLGLLFHRTGWIGMAFIAAALSMLAVDLQSDAAMPGLIAYAAMFPVSLWLGPVILRVLPIIFLIVLVPKLVGERFEREFLMRSGEVGPADPSLPPVIHVILDEVANDFRLPDGFTRYPQAHSRYFSTSLSIPEIVTDFHARLENRGYRFHVWQPNYMNICRSEGECVLYWGNRIAPYLEQGLSQADGIRLTLYAMARLGPVTERLAYSISPHVPHAYLNGLNSKESLERFMAEASQAEPGHAYVIHALLPHYPFAMDRHCQLLPVEQWISWGAAFSLADKQAAYSEQAECTESLLSPLEAVDAVTIVHGDHGTRFFDLRDGSGRRRDQVELDQEAFNTLFAIKIPGKDAEERHVVAGISSLLSDFADRDLRALPDGREQTVFAGKDNDHLKERAMKHRVGSK